MCLEYLMPRRTEQNNPSFLTRALVASQAPIESRRLGRSAAAATGYQPNYITSVMIRSGARNGVKSVPLLPEPMRSDSWLDYRSFARNNADQNVR